MDSYLDIIISGDKNFVNHRFSNLMSEFIEMFPAYDGKIAIGFPEQTNKQNMGIKNQLGNTIRLFGTEQDLEDILNDKKNSDFRRLYYTKIQYQKIEKIPLTNKYVKYSRVRNEKYTKGFVERQNRRRKKRGLEPISYNKELCERKYLNCPFITVKMDNENLPIFLKKEENQARNLSGYNNFGLSKEESTVPDF